MRLVLAALVAVFGAVVVPAAPAMAGDPGTQPIHDYASAVRERVWVQSTVDSDSDGKPDRVAVRVIRPSVGFKVPVIFQASPYYAGLNDVPNHDDIDRDGGLAVGSAAVADRAQNITFAGYLDNYFVPRGYAVVFADSLGTGDSEGCPTSGGRNETLGAKAVVDWLNGRAPGFDEAGNPVSAGWSTGRTGMIGVSYNGTLPNAVAATGVKGLETIVPIAAISSWYDYYRANGGVVAPGGFQGEDTDVLAKAVLTRENPELCADVMADLEREQDRETGDYSAYWAERDYLRDVNKVRPASCSCTACTTTTCARCRPVSGGTRSPRAACLARSGCIRPGTPTPSTYAGSSGSPRSTGGSTSGSTRSTRASCVSRSPMWRPHPASGRRHGAGR